MRVLFLPHGERKWAGPRFRAWWIADHWPEADCCRWEGTGPSLDGYDAIVLGKVLDLYDRAKYAAVHAFAAQVHKSGRLLVWDFCDPTWWWNTPETMRGILEYCDAITVSSPSLAEDFARAFGRTATVIPDRMPFVREIKTHRETAQPVLVWFGYSFNRNHCLLQQASFLTRLVYEGVPFILRIIDDRPDVRAWPLKHGIPEIETEAWDLERFHHQLLATDIAFLPPYHGPLGKLKSNNKAVSAWWAGLPVDFGSNYYALRDLIGSADLRAEQGTRNRRHAEAYYEIGRSVDEWKSLLSSLRETRFNGSLAIAGMPSGRLLSA